MKKLLIDLSGGIILIALLLGSIVYLSLPVQGESTSSSCTASTSRVTIGHQQSRTILATSSRRAFARIQQPDNASNTVHLKLGGAPATLATASAQLEKVSATGTLKTFETGLNADLPYVGEVSALSDSGSTSVLVIDCLY